MNFYSDETYGERVAGVYDEWHSEYDPLAIDALAELAQNGKALENMEKRLTQALQAIDDQRQWIYRTITTFGMFVAILVIFGVGYFIYKTAMAPYTPPQVNQIVPGPSWRKDRERRSASRAAARAAASISLALGAR